MYSNTQDAIWMESGMAGKNPKVLMENKLTRSQKCMCAAKKLTPWVVLASRLMEVVLSLHSVLLRPHLDHCAQSWTPWVQGRYRHTRARSVEAIKGLEFSYERLKGL